MSDALTLLIAQLGTVPHPNASAVAREAALQQSYEQIFLLLHRQIQVLRARVDTLEDESRERNRNPVQHIPAPYV